MSDVTERAQTLAAALEGSCQGAPDEVFEVPGLAEALDELVFECQECGWWYETAELSENDEHENICRDCGREKDDDDT